MTEIIPSKTVTILPSGISVGGVNMCLKIDRAVIKSLIGSMALGYDTFLCSLITPFDVMAAKDVLLMREQQPTIRLILVRTLRSHDFMNDYPEITEQADAVVDYDRILDKSCYDFMIERSSAILCYHKKTSLYGHDKRILTAATHGYLILNIAALMFNVSKDYENKLRNIQPDK